MTDHIQFTTDRITTTNRPRHTNDPSLKGFVRMGRDSLFGDMYRGVYDGDPSEELDIVNDPSLAVKPDPTKAFVVLDGREPLL